MSDNLTVPDWDDIPEDDDAEPDDIGDEDEAMPDLPPLPGEEDRPA